MLLYGPVPDLWVAIGGCVSVQNVVLGELIWRRGRGYGYELRDQLLEFSEALGFSETIVYAALDALERKGLVRVVGPEAVAAGGRQARTRVYHEVTDEGHRHFRGWMASIPQVAAVREELYMQLMEARPEDVPHLIEALDAFEVQCREQLRRLIERPLRSSAARGGGPGPPLVQDALIAQKQTMMEWAQRSRAALVNLVESSTGVPGRHRP